MYKNEYHWYSFKGLTARRDSFIQFGNNEFTHRKKDTEMEKSLISLQAKAHEAKKEILSHVI